MAPQDLNRLLEESLMLLYSELLAGGVVLERDISPGLPYVMGDRIQLQQVVLNLVRNACEAVRHLPSERRGVRVSTGIHQNRVFVAVRDHGDGIGGNIEQIFQPYFTTKSQGLGLGLSICRSIIQAHHGWLWAENHPQGGAVFHMELPIGEGGGAG